KIRYKQTVIGIAWAVLQPVLTVAIFTVLFSRFAQFDTGHVPYPLLALSGLVLWLFVHNAVSMASTSFVSNTNLVTKVYFPRIILPASAALAGIVDLAITLVILVGFEFYYRTAVDWQILFAPVFLLLTIILAISLGTLFSALNVRFRDVKFALPFMLQVWMIASPIFYPASIVPEKWRLVFAINPLTGILDGFRSSLFGNPFDWEVIAVSCLSVLVMALFSLFIFKWMEDDFADIV
ncbi:MAG: ABC transporter permease, partial [Acidobacteriota bacterium]